MPWHMLVYYCSLTQMTQVVTSINHLNEKSKCLQSTVNTSKLLPDKSKHKFDVEIMRTKCQHT